jgi:large subunit ribosomal protein L25
MEQRSVPSVEIREKGLILLENTFGSLIFIDLPLQPFLKRVKSNLKMEVFSIDAHTKDVSGKGPVSRLRREGFTPCVMYGTGKAISFALTEPQYRHLVFTPNFQLCEIKHEGVTYKAIVKDIQFDPMTNAVRHLDFLMLEPGKKFKAKIPLRFKGVSPGVKLGGKFLTLVRTINVLTTPEAVVAEIYADISTMDLGSTIRIRDIQPVAGITISNTPATPIATIEIPRALKSAQAAANAPETKKKK